MILVGIDAGHGTPDLGASYGGVHEKDLTLAIARRLRQAINGAGWDVCGVLTRDDDADMDYATRRSLLDKYAADFVFSIHANAIGDTTTRGLIAFYKDDDSKSWDIAKVVARCAPVELVRVKSGVIQATNDPTTTVDDWKRRAWNVLAAYHRPAVLVETGFLTNEGDRAALQRSDVQDGIVAACMAGIARLLAYH